MKICIRADGGSKIGMGHVMRMLALAKELRKSNDVFFACRVNEPISDEYLPGIELIKSNNFSVVEIKEDKLKEDIKNIIADCIISDSYDVDEEYFDILKENFELSGYIDDEKICDFFNVDFVVNQNLYGASLDYKVNENTKMMLGSKFVILRDDFRKKIKDKVINRKIKDVMVTMGGSDDNNLTEKIINELKDEEYTLHIVVGRGFNKVDNLRLYENDKVKLYINADMKFLMEMCDVCIAGCGSTIYELCICKTPFIGIPVVENQEMLAEYIEKNNISRISKIEDIKEKINTFTYNERKIVSDNLGKLVDGNGIFRIADEINIMLKGKRER